MKCLLDVNTLIALGVVEHEFHARVTRWVRRLKSDGAVELLTCLITELGFVRVLSQTKLYEFDVTSVRALLMRMKTEGKALFTFLGDDQDISELPRWVKKPKQITHGHLAQLAKANDSVLATLDGGITGALLIPE